MRLVVCQSCQSKYRVDTNKIIGKGEFQCPKCRHTIKVNRSTLSVTSKQEIELPSYVSDYSPKDHDQLIEPDVNSNDFTTPQSRAVNKRDKHSEIDKISWKNSMRMKIGSIIVATSFIILSVYIVFNYLQNNTKLAQELDQFAEIASIRLSKSMALQVWEVDERQVKDIIDSEMLDKRIVAIVVRDNNLKTAHVGRRNSKWNPVSYLLDPTLNTEKKQKSLSAIIGGDYIRKDEKIKHKNETIGSVEVYVTDKFMQEKSRRAAIFMVLSAIIFIFSILITIFIVVRKFMILPITKLTYAAEQMSLGDLKVNVGVHSRDEIGTLAQAIERMQASLDLALNRWRRNR